MKKQYIKPATGISLVDLQSIIAYSNSLDVKPGETNEQCSKESEDWNIWNSDEEEF